MQYFDDNVLSHICCFLGSDAPSLFAVDKTSSAFRRSSALAWTNLARTIGDERLSRNNNTDGNGRSLSPKERVVFYWKQKQFTQKVENEAVQHVQSNELKHYHSPSPFQSIAGDECEYFVRIAQQKEANGQGTWDNLNVVFEGFISVGVKPTELVTTPRIFLDAKCVAQDAIDNWGSLGALLGRDSATSTLLTCSTPPSAKNVMVTITALIPDLNWPAGIRRAKVYQGTPAKLSLRAQGQLGAGFAVAFCTLAAQYVHFVFDQEGKLRYLSFPIA